MPAVFLFLFVCLFYFRCSRWCNVTGQRRWGGDATTHCHSVCCVRNERKLIVIQPVVGSHYRRSYWIATSQEVLDLCNFLKNKRQDDKNMCLIKHRNVHPSMGGGGGGDTITYWVFSQDNHRAIFLLPELKCFVCSLRCFLLLYVHSFLSY